MDRRPATLKVKVTGRPDSIASQQGVRGRAPGGREARLGSEAGWATNPKTRAKKSYNPALPPRPWALIKKSGRCYKCFGIFGPDHVCPSDTLSQEVPSREVRSDEVSHIPSSLGSSDIVELEQNIVGDEPESWDGTPIIQTGQCATVSPPVTVHSSLDAIATVCEEVMAMDLQEGTPSTTRIQSQAFVSRNPRIWVPTPKIGVPVHATSSVGGPPASIDWDDRMIHPRIFKQIQKLCNPTFTLDACANNSGDNTLCS